MLNKLVVARCQGGDGGEREGQCQDPGCYCTTVLQAVTMGKKLGRGTQDLSLLLLTAAYESIVITKYNINKKNGLRNSFKTVE